MEAQVPLAFMTPRGQANVEMMHNMSKIGPTQHLQSTSLATRKTTKLPSIYV